MKLVTLMLISFLIMCCTLTEFSPAVLFKGPDLAHSQDVQQTPAAIRRFLNDVYFITPQTGWAVGGGGDVLKTVTSGKRWSRQRISNRNFLRIAFQNENNGWIVDDRGEILTTHDGGNTWTLRPPPALGAFKLQFITPSIGWMIGRHGLILKTDDGGKIWKRQDSRSNSDLTDISCFRAEACIIVGDKRTILSTSDGGHTWTERYPPTQNLNFHKVMLTKDGIAWAIGIGEPYNALLRSNDRGETWTVINGEMAGDQSALFFWNSKLGVVVGNGVDRTEDGGLTWVRSKGSTGPLLSAVVFVDRNVGWAVGDFKTVLQSKDGGQTWHQQYGGSMSLH